MLSYLVKRLLFAVPVLIGASMINFTVLCHAPGDPSANLPLSIPAEERQKYREALGLDQACHVRYLKWARQFFIIEPMLLAEQWTDDDGQKQGT